MTLFMRRKLGPSLVLRSNEQPRRRISWDVLMAQTISLRLRRSLNLFSKSIKPPIAINLNGTIHLNATNLPNQIIVTSILMPAEHPYLFGTALYQNLTIVDLQLLTASQASFDCHLATQNPQPNNPEGRTLSREASVPGTFTPLDFGRFTIQACHRSPPIIPHPHLAQEDHVQASRMRFLCLVVRSYPKVLLSEACRWNESHPENNPHC
jgi:hypothetical protein